LSGKNKVDKMPVARARMHPAALVFVCLLKDRVCHHQTKVVFPSLWQKPTPTHKAVRH